MMMAIGFLGLSLDAQDEHDDHAHEQGKQKETGDGHDEHKDIVALTVEEQKAFGIQTAVAGAGDLEAHVSLSGKVVVNPDRFAHIVPRVAGVVRKVHKNLGDQVKAGDVMAIIESRELSDLKSGFLGAKARLALAEVTFRREEKLWDEGISAEREYLNAKQGWAEARIESESAEHKLHALGFSDAYLNELPHHTDMSYTRNEILAPFDGVVVAKHITLGENLKDDAEVFSVADLSSVWVMLTVYQKDLPYLTLGGDVHISNREGGLLATGKVSYVSPIIDEKTRTATARVVLPNDEGQWRPGLFVNGAVEREHERVALLVPKTALQTVEDKVSVFVLTDEGFEPHPVAVGRTNVAQAEITGGLKTGQRYVTQGAFTLKAQLEKGAFGDGHAH